MVIERPAACQIHLSEVGLGAGPESLVSVDPGAVGGELGEEVLVGVGEALVVAVVLEGLPGHPVAVPEDESLQLVAEDRESLEDPGGEMMAVADVQTHNLRIVLQKGSEEVVSQELEAGESQVSDMTRSRDDLKGLLVDPLVVAEVEVSGEREVGGHQTVQLGATAADLEEV